MNTHCYSLEVSRGDGLRKKCPYSEFRKSQYSVRTRKVPTKKIPYIDIFHEVIWNENGIVKNEIFRSNKVECFH